MAERDHHPVLGREANKTYNEMVRAENAAQEIVKSVIKVEFNEGGRGYNVASRERASKYVSEIGFEEAQRRLDLASESRLFKELEKTEDPDQHDKAQIAAFVLWASAIREYKPGQIKRILQDKHKRVEPPNKL